MHQIKRKSNKIPRKRLPSLLHKTVYQPKIKFFQKIQNSFSLLQQPSSSQIDTQIQLKRKIQQSHLTQKKSFLNRIKILAMHKNYTRSQLNNSYQRQSNMITKSQSQKASRLKKVQIYNNQSKNYKNVQMPQYINSKPLGNEQIVKYLRQLDNSPIKKSLFNNDLTKNENDQEQPLAVPLLLNGIMDLSKNIIQKMKIGKQQYLYNKIMGQAPYQQKYNQFHKKLTQKIKRYKNRKFQLNHKYDWRI